MRDSPARDIWFLHAVHQGSYQMGRVVGTSPSPPSVGVTGGLSPPPPTLLEYKGTSPGPNGLGAQALQSHGPNGLEVHRFQAFSISRFAGHTRMLGPSVFPDSCVLSLLGPLMPKSISSDTQHQRYKFRHPKYKFRHPKQAV